MGKIYDTIIIGGGFYGCVLACYLKKKGQQVVIVEKEDDIVKRASYANQARIHNGYHYPRSFLTAIRSHVNYKRFNKDFKPAVYSNFAQYYALASTLSKTTGRQFYKFAKQIGSPIAPAPETIKNYFNPNTIDDVFTVDEIVFNARILRNLLKKKLTKRGIKVLYKTEIFSVEQGKNNLVTCNLSGNKKISGKKVFNCTYSQINRILERSNLPLLPFKQEFIEMPLIRVPDELRNVGISIFDGPFFGFLPFPDENCHSLWHVRYSILANWTEPIMGNLENKLKNISKRSNWNYMKKDMQRFIPIMAKAKYLKSIYEIKTVLVQTEESDARPILFRKDYCIQGFNLVLGSKIDNIYDIIEKIKEEKLD